MADDERLLELLARALDPGDVQPPAERIAALRIQAAARQEPESASPTDAAEPAASAPPPPPVPRHLPAPAPGRAPTGLRSRRGGWLAAGAAVAAAAVAIALIAVPSMVRDRSGDRSVASGPAASARDAVRRLQAALVSRDPLAVAEADAALVRLARQLPPAERARVEAEVLEARVEAIQFLREHLTPEALAVVPTDPEAGTPPPTTVTDGGGPVPTSLPAGEPAVPTTAAPSPVPPTTATPVPSVTITGVTPTVDGPFAVEFTVSGFTPENSRRPGSYAIRFSFDDGQEPEVWDGPSPWTFPTDKAVRHKQVCAVVVDARRVEEPGSGNCVPIL